MPAMLNSNFSVSDGVRFMGIPHIAEFFASDCKTDLRHAHVEVNVRGHACMEA